MSPKEFRDKNEGSDDNPRSYWRPYQEEHTGGIRGIFTHSDSTYKHDIPDPEISDNTYRPPSAEFTQSELISEIPSGPSEFVDISPILPGLGSRPHKTGPTIGVLCAHDDEAFGRTIWARLENAQIDSWLSVAGPHDDALQRFVDVASTCPYLVCVQSRRPPSSSYLHQLRIAANLANQDTNPTNVVSILHDTVEPSTVLARFQSIGAQERDTTRLIRAVKRGVPLGVDVALNELAEELSRRQQETTGPNDPAIFLSYRRSDQPAFTGRVYDRLKTEFGTRHVFMDVESISIGENFEERLDLALAACKLMLVFIGSNWLRISDAAGRRCIDQRRDFVRREIRRAVERGVPIAPILIDETTMPTREDLPKKLRSLSTRQALRMTNENFSRDWPRVLDDVARMMR